MKNTLLFFSVIMLVSCNSTKMKNDSKIIDVQGHRGCRGILPENTIKAFDKALELGVSTLEMDLVISADKEVVVSHEPFFNHEIAIAPDKTEITKENELEHNLYQLTYDQIKAYDVGLKPHPKFPTQENQAAVKPLFKDVVTRAEIYSSQLKRPLPFYNVEIKRKSDSDNTYHPDGQTFAELVVKEVQATGIKDRIYIQSFDIESLQIVRSIDPSIKLVLLIYNQDTPLLNLDKLGFVPEVYSPYFELVNKELSVMCKSKNMKLIPWTVNEIDDMNKMLELGVDGIITDYPNLLLSLINTSTAFEVMK